jgi:hypothetical protein
MRRLILSVTIALSVAVAAPAFAGDALPPAVEAAISDAVARGVPREPLEAKAREGLAKGIPAERIVVALGGLTVDLRAANDLVGAGGPIEAAASAVRAGASPGAIRSVLASAPAGTEAAAVYSLGDVMAAGLDEAAAVELVSAALASEHPVDRLRGLATATATLIRGGMAPSAVVARLSGDPTLALPLEGGPEHEPNGHAYGHDGGNGSGNGNGNADGGGGGREQKVRS